MALQSKVKVLHLIHSLEMGGAQKVIANLVKHHDRERFIPAVGSLRRAGPLESLMHRAGAEVVYFDKKSPVDIGCASRLRRYIGNEGIGIVNAHNFSASFWGRLACAGLNDVAFVVTEHGRVGFPAFRIRFINRILARGVDTIIAVSEETAAFLGKVYPYNAHKIRVVINGIDLPDGPGWSRERLQEEFAIPVGSKVIVNVAAHTPVKNQAMLIRAFEMLMKDVGEARLLLIGDGPLRGELERLVRDLKLDEYVIFAGERIDGPDIVGACDVFCLSSRAEGTSMAALEAMARSCPVVLTAVGGNADIIRNEIDGLLVSYGEAESLTVALQRILKDREFADSLVSSAAARLAPEFSAATMTRRTEEIYAETLGVLR
jgi:glycosyltransferase involved in cell wall biosynthesis